MDFKGIDEEDEEDTFAERNSAEGDEDKGECLCLKLLHLLPPCSIQLFSCWPEAREDMITALAIILLVFSSFLSPRSPRRE